MFPADFLTATKKSNIPTYTSTIPSELFHFDSIQRFNFLPKNILAIRVTVLKDATLLGFRNPHLFFDADSTYQIIKAYSDIIAGKEIPTSVLLPDSPLSEILRDEVQFQLLDGVEVEGTPYLLPLEKLQLGLVPLLGTLADAAIKNLGSMLGISSMVSEGRFIHLPGTLVEQWKSECEAELGTGTSSTPKISKLDVVTAWFIKVSFQILNI